MKILYLDTETSGLDHTRHALLEVALIVEVDGKVLDERVYKLRPHDTATLEPEALRINGISNDSLLDPERLTHPQAYKKIKSLLLTHIDRYDKTDKFHLMGQNVGFDFDFLQSLWKRNQDDYLGSFIHYHKIDLTTLTACFRMAGKFTTPLPNMKLSSLCDYFAIGGQKHTALDDIRKTRTIFGYYLERLAGARSIDKVDPGKPPFPV